MGVLSGVEVKVAVAVCVLVAVKVEVAVGVSVGKPEAPFNPKEATKSKLLVLARVQIASV